MPKVMAQFRLLLGPAAALPPLASPEQQRSMQNVDVMAQEMRSAAKQGVCACIVDAGHPGHGPEFSVPETACP